MCMPVVCRPHNGGRPVLRSVPPDYVSRKEAKRLIDNVSKLVVVTVRAKKLFIYILLLSFKNNIFV